MTASARLRAADADAQALPEWPQGWYAVARARDVRPGELVHGELAKRPFVVFRTARGKLVALDAHCPHMGAHLRHGRVVGERLRCALHHFHFDTEGQPDAAACASARRWRVEEHLGLLFLQLGDHDPGPLPTPDRAQDYVWTTSRPMELTADWRAMVVNGFDMAHLAAVHRRELLEPARVAIEEGGSRIRLRYTSRVTGRGISDRVMKWLARDRIRVQQTCHGTVMVVESDLGRTQSTAVLALRPLGARVRAFAAFGVRPGPFSAARLMLTRWLFTAFLRRDFSVVEDMQLRTDVTDHGVRAMDAFLRGRPRVTP